MNRYTNTNTYASASTIVNARNFMYMMNCGLKYYTVRLKNDNKAGTIANKESSFLF